LVNTILEFFKNWLSERLKKVKNNNFWLGVQIGIFIIFVIIGGGIYYAVNNSESIKESVKESKPLECKDTAEACKKIREQSGIRPNI